MLVLAGETENMWADADVVAANSCASDLKARRESSATRAHQDFRNL